MGRENHERLQIMLIFFFFFLIISYITSLSEELGGVLRGKLQGVCARYPDLRLQAALSGGVWSGARCQFSRASLER